MGYLFALGVGFVIGYLFGGMGTARNAVARVEAQKKEWKALAMTALLAQDRAAELWDKAVLDTWKSLAMFRNAKPDDPAWNDARKQANEVWEEAKAAHQEARVAWGRVGPAWGDVQL